MNRIYSDKKLGLFDFDNINQINQDHTFIKFSDTIRFVDGKYCKDLKKLFIMIVTSTNLYRITINYPTNKSSIFAAIKNKKTDSFHINEFNNVEVNSMKISFASKLQREKDCICYLAFGTTNGSIILGQINNNEEGEYYSEKILKKTTVVGSLLNYLSFSGNKEIEMEDLEFYKKKILISISNDHRMKIWNLELNTFKDISIPIQEKDAIYSGLQITNKDKDNFILVIAYKFGEITRVILFIIFFFCLIFFKQNLIVLHL